MNKIISFCGLILFSLLGFSLKAKADPTWSNWATCPAATWAVGFTISKASLSFDGSPNKINGLKLECADLDKSPASFISANPLDGRGGLNWQNPVFVGAGFVSGITTRLNLRPYLSHFTDGSAIIGDNAEIILSDDRFPGVGDEGGWAECGPGEAVNGLMVASDETMFSAVSVSCSSYQSAIDARTQAAADAQKANKIELLRQYADREQISLKNDFKSATIHKISFEAMSSNLHGASCAINEIFLKGPTRDEFDKIEEVFIATFGHTDWAANATDCDKAPLSIINYTGCTDGTLDPICLNREGYLDIKSRYEKKHVDYIKYRDEANQFGERDVCLSMERLARNSLFDFGMDKASISKIADSLYDTCI